MSPRSRLVRTHSRRHPSRAAVPRARNNLAEALADSIHRCPGGIVTPATSRNPAVPSQPWRSPDSRRSRGLSGARRHLRRPRLVRIRTAGCHRRARGRARETNALRVLRGLPTGTPEYERAKLSVIDALRARRNHPGGYWIAKDDPDAAMQAVTGSVPLGQLNGAALSAMEPVGSWTPTAWRGGRCPRPVAHDRPRRDPPTSPRSRDRGPGHRLARTSASPTTRLLPTGEPAQRRRQVSQRRRRVREATSAASWFPAQRRLCQARPLAPAV